MKIDKRTPTKQRILNILKKDHRCTIKDMMKYFSISEIAVRRHLGELEQQGFIQKKSVKQEIGRPFFVYELTEKGHLTFPNQYERLPLELLKDLESIHGKDAVNAVLAKRMEREKDFFATKIHTNDFDQKITEIVKLQNEKGFIIEYSKLPNGDYELINYNCPVINIASTYRQLCKNEKKVLSTVLPNSEVQPSSCIASSDHYCKWIITKPKNKTGKGI